jgi:uncharacterized protein YjbJ (UPF0337 family)
MQQTQIENWKQFKEEAIRQWDRLPEDRLCHIDGCRVKLSAEIQHAYGVEKEQADKQIERWEEHCRKRKAA